MGWNDCRYGHMVNDYYVERVRKIFEERTKERSLVRTRRDAEKLTAGVRSSFRRIFGPWPEKNPLKPRVTGVINAGAYRIEKILIESRPSFLVPVNLYVPAQLRGPAPAILMPCGHSAEGKADTDYQAFAQGMVRKGFVVLIYDPIGQGERIQYPTPEGKTKLGLCSEHNLLGGQLSLCGGWFGAWRTWDGIRCLDYLLSRPEVDASRVGVAGNSGGGTITGWLTAVEPRFTMAAPSCWVTSILRNVENELPCDAEQIPPGFLAAGLDHADCFLAYAPRPVIILAQSKDFFDVRGTREAYEQVRHIYRLLGAEKNVQLFMGPNPHDFSSHIRKAMCGFFSRYSGLKPSFPKTPPFLRTEQELFVTGKGTVGSAGSRQVHDLLVGEVNRLARQRKPVRKAELPGMLKKLLAVPARKGVPYYRILRRAAAGSERWQAYAVETEPGIQAIVTMVYNGGDCFAVPREKSCTLLVPDQGAAADLRDRKLRDRLPAGGRLFAVDPRGIGQSRPAGCDCLDFNHRYDCDYHFNSIGIMLGEPYQGRRVYDVLRTLDWLYAAGYRKIHLAGHGLGAVTALFAAVLEPKVAGLTILNGPGSYGEVACGNIHKWPDSILVPGILRHLDLPDIVRRFD